MRRISLLLSCTSTALSLWISTASAAPRAPAVRCPPGTHRVDRVLADPQADDQVQYRQLACIRSDDVLVGAFVESWLDGTKRREGAYVDGKEDGLLTTWQPDGQLASRGTYRLGLREGEWTSFWTSDEVAWSGRFRGGRSAGRFRWYHRNGKLEHECTFVEGKPDGASPYWDEHGVLLRTEHWRNGVLVATDPPAATR